MHIQISNLNLNMAETDLQRLFKAYGEIAAITLERDKFNNRSRGRAVIDMPVDKQALMAITSLDGTVLGGKAIAVTALPHTQERPNWNL